MNKRKGGRFKVKKSTKQNAWNYMKRHRKFRVGDMALSIDASLSTVKSFLWFLQQIGYAKKIKIGKSQSDCLYVLLKHTGSQSPSISKMEVFDHNTGECFTVMKKTHTELICREILTINKTPFSLKDIVVNIGEANKRRVYSIVKILRKKEVLVLDSIGKRNTRFFKIATFYKGVLDVR